MATFGPIASAAPNVLFSPMMVDQAVQGRQRNQLMMDSARQDQQQQTFQRDATARIGMARELANLPEAQAAAEWGTYRQRLQASGLGQGLPEQFPGMERLRAVASSDLTTFQRQQLQHQQQELALKQQGQTFSFGPSGGAPVAAPASAPTGAPMAGVPPELMPHFEEASRATGVPVPLLIAQAQQESGFRPDATGRSGEVGIMQIMPSTAQQPGFGMQGVDPATLRDPRANIMFGAQYLAARNQGTNWNDPAQRDAGLGRYNGGGDPNYAANVTRNLPGATGPAARTGGTNMAGPGVPAPTAAADAPRMLYRGSSPFTEGLPSGQAWGQTADGRRVAMDIPGARMPRQPAEPGGPIPGQGLDSGLLNILITGDPSSPQYAAAFARLGAEEVLANGNTRRPDMSPFRAPTYRPPGVMEPGVAPAAAPGPQSAGDPAAAAPAPAAGALPEGGRSYGRAETTQVQQVTPAAREAVRKAEAEVGRITGAIDRFEQVFKQQGGGSFDTYINNPRDPKAQTLLAAYEAMKATLRSEAFLNTGVLQPAEARMLDDMLLSPTSLRGAAATPEAMSARLQEFRDMVRRGLETQRASAGITRPVAGPNGQGTAEPPAAHPPLPPGFTVVQ